MGEYVIIFKTKTSVTCVCLISLRSSIKKDQLKKIHIYILKVSPPEKETGEEKL